MEEEENGGKFLREFIGSTLHRVPYRMIISILFDFQRFEYLIFISESFFTY